MQLKDVIVGEYFIYTDKFDHGFIRQYHGQKIGDTITFWSAVKLSRIHDYNPQTEVVRMDSDAERFTLMDGRILVKEDKPPKPVSTAPTSDDQNK